MSWLLVATALCLLVADVQPKPPVTNERRHQLLTGGRKYVLGDSARRADAVVTDTIENDDDDDGDQDGAPGVVAVADRDRQIASFVVGILRNDIRQMVAALRCRVDQYPTRGSDYQMSEPIEPMYWMMRSSGGDLGSARRLPSRTGIGANELLFQPQQPRQIRSSSRYASQMDDITRTLGTSGLYTPEVDDDVSTESVNDDGSSSQNRQQERVRLLNQLTRTPMSRQNGQPRRQRYPALRGKRPLVKAAYLLNPLTRQMINRRL